SHGIFCVQVTKIDSLKLKQEEKKGEKTRRDDEDEIYSYSNYFPLSAKLVHRSLFRSTGVEKFLDALTSPSAPARQTQTLDPPSICLVFFVGGCCYAELAALRSLWTTDRAQGLLR